MQANEENTAPKFISIWANQVRAPFLLLSVLLTSVGGAMAYQARMFHGGWFLLTTLGVTLAHVAVNLFNEYSDFVTGIDSRTRRTPFSGGSGNLQSGRSQPEHVRLAAWTSLGLAGMIGVYLAGQSSWWLLIIMALGGATAIFYTTHLSKWSLGEFMAGLTLGTLVVVGAYWVQTNTITWPVIWISCVSGILTTLLLLLNEFPDLEADQQGGRRHLVIRLGWKKAAIIYTVTMTLQYALLAIGAWLGWLPVGIMLTWLTLPLAAMAAGRVLQFGNQWEKMVPALGANVAVVLGTNALIALVYWW